VYTLINALRLLCPRLDEDDCERAFCALIRALERQGCSMLSVIHRGLTRRELLRLIGFWQRFAAREFGITLAVNRLKVPEPSLRGIWKGLRQALDGKSIAIIGLDGVERHWTVVHAATERTLRVADSSGLRAIFRSQCTAKSSSLRYRLRPSEVLVVRREKSTGTRKQPCRSRARS
jgi:hypothetical protein